MYRIALPPEMKLRICKVQNLPSYRMDDGRIDNCAPVQGKKIVNEAAFNPGYV
jgi:hypothetical protein